MKGLSVSKKNKKQYRKLPHKEAESKPWDELCVDLIGQYQFTPKGRGKMTTKYRKIFYLQKDFLFTGRHNDRPSYRLDRNSNS